MLITVNTLTLDQYWLAWLESRTRGIGIDYRTSEYSEYYERHPATSPTIQLGVLKVGWKDPGHDVRSILRSELPIDMIS